MALSLGDVDVAVLLAEAVRRNEQLAESSGVVVVSPPAEALGTIRADARLGYVKTLRTQIDIAYSEYKKFQSESKFLVAEDK